LLIAVAPALGYGLAYVYRFGYCDVYHIPSDLIRLDLTTILIAIAASLGILAILAWFAFMMMTIPLYISATRKRIYFSIVFLVFLGLFSGFFLTIDESKQLGIMFLFFLFFVFVIPWFIRRFPTKRRKRQDIPINRLVNNKYFGYGFVVFFVVIAILVSGYLAGRSDARKKEIFYVPSSNPQLIVLKVYGDNIVCGELVQETDKVGLGPRIDLLKLNNLSDLTLTPIKIKLSFTQFPK
jgi:hypothetical protein